MGFFAWKLWSERRKNEGKHHILSGLRIRRMKSTPEKITPWYGVQTDSDPPRTPIRRDNSHPPDPNSASRLPSSSFGSHSSSNSTVPSHGTGFATDSPTTYLPPRTPSYNYNPLSYPKCNSSNIPQTQLMRSPSRSSQSSSSTASTSLSSYPLTTATYTFNPTRDDELPLAIGLSLRVVATFDDGWAWVIDDQNEERRGMVPCECLEMYTGSTSTSSDTQGASSTTWSASTSKSAEVTNWDHLSPTQSESREQANPSTGTSKRLSMMTVTDISERSSSLNHSYGSSASTMTGDLLWVKPKKRLRVQNPDTDT